MLASNNTLGRSCVARVTFSLIQRRNRAKPRVLVLAGPTGVGKSALSVRIAKRLGGEIVSADSVQVYQGLDVGAGKLVGEETQGVPHHLIDVVPPTHDYNAKDFSNDANTVLHDIVARGRLPIVVGGSGFYLDLLMFGLPPVPPSDKERVAQLKERYHAEENWETSLSHLRAVDPVQADRIIPNDYTRLARAMEVFLVSGRPLSSFVRKKIDPPFDYRCIVLCAPRTTLYRRIDARCEDMVYRGLVQEAAWLSRKYGYETLCSSVRMAIGYRQAFDYIRSTRDWSQIGDDARFLAFLRDLTAASRNFAQRQLKWFRHETKPFKWLPCEEDMETMMERVEQELSLPEDKYTASLKENTNDRQSWYLSKDEKQEIRRYQPHYVFFASNAQRRGTIRTIAQFMKDLKQI